MVLPSFSFFTARLSHSLALALQIAFAEGQLGISIVLLCGLGEILYGFEDVLLYTLAVLVGFANLVLCLGISLICRFEVPFKGQGVAFFHAVALVVAAAQAILSLLVALFGCGFQFGESGFVALGVVKLLAVVVKFLG